MVVFTLCALGAALGVWIARRVRVLGISLAFMCIAVGLVFFLAVAGNYHVPSALSPRETDHTLADGKNVLQSADDRLALNIDVRRARSCWRTLEITNQTFLSEYAAFEKHQVIAQRSGRWASKGDCSDGRGNWIPEVDKLISEEIEAIDTLQSAISEMEKPSWNPTHKTADDLYNAHEQAMKTANRATQELDTYFADHGV